MSMTESEVKLFNNLMEHNSAYYGYELSKGEIKTVLQAFEQLKQYRAIDTVEECRVLKEKSVAKKVIRLNDNDYYDYKCPTCGRPDKDCMGKRYCNCGQALD